MRLCLEDILEVPEPHGHPFCSPMPDVDISSPTIVEQSDELFSASFMIQVVRPRTKKIGSTHPSFQDICCCLHYQVDEDTITHHVWNLPNSVLENIQVPHLTLTTFKTPS